MSREMMQFWMDRGFGVWVVKIYSVYLRHGYFESSIFEVIFDVGHFLKVQRHS